MMTCLECYQERPATSRRRLFRFIRFLRCLGAFHSLVGLTLRRAGASSRDSIEITDTLDKAEKTEKPDQTMGLGDFTFSSASRFELLWSRTQNEHIISCETIAMPPPRGFANDLASV
jgi:hypothetical protein